MEQRTDKPSVAILADDLMWSTRLSRAVSDAGGMPLVIRDLPELAKVLGDVSYVIVDLTARAYEGVAAVEIAAHGQNHVLAVGQHDDAELRRRALEAGAEQVYPYRLLFERGPDTLAKWFAGPAPVRRPTAEPA
jgi:DNA-binding response OmpR family regulator